MWIDLLEVASILSVWECLRNGIKYIFIFDTGTLCKCRLVLEYLRKFARYFIEQIWVFLLYEIKTRYYFLLEIKKSYLSEFIDFKFNLKLNQRYQNHQSNTRHRTPYDNSTKLTSNKKRHKSYKISIFSTCSRFRAAGVRLRHLRPPRTERSCACEGWRSANQ